MSQTRDYSIALKGNHRKVNSIFAEGDIYFRKGDGASPLRVLRIRPKTYQEDKGLLKCLSQ